MNLRETKEYKPLRFRSGAIQRDQVQNGHEADPSTEELGGRLSIVPVSGVPLPILCQYLRRSRSFKIKRAYVVPTFTNKLCLVGSHLGIIILTRYSRRVPEDG